MQKSTAPNSSFDESEGDGADSVQKTGYLAGKGTDDRANRVSTEPGEVGSDGDRDAPERRGTDGTEGT